MTDLPLPVQPVDMPAVFYVYFLIAHALLLMILFVLANFKMSYDRVHRVEIQKALDEEAARRAFR